MKPSSTRRARRRNANGPQQEQKKDQRFFGGETHQPFFQPGAALSRAPEAPEEKKEKKIERAPEEKKEESLQLAPVEPEEKRKEEKEKEKEAKDKVSRAATNSGEEKKEEKISKKGEAGGAGESTVRYLEGIGGKGQPLPSSERKYFGERMGYDFGAVRIHTGEEAADSARDARAKAYTYGRHIVFNEGRFNPGSQEGRKLLAHELAHVVQKAPASGHVHRKTGDAPAPAPTPHLPKPSDPDLFRNRLSIAFLQMKTPTVLLETIAGNLEPILREMAANAEWVDVSGASSGGAEVPVKLPGGRKVNLRLVLDDTPDPKLDGSFTSTGADQGTMRVFVRKNGGVDDLAETLFHESLHLLRWLARNAPGGDLAAETGAGGGAKATLEAIDPSRYPQHLAMVRRDVSDLAASVNAARPSGDQIDGAGIDRVTTFMFEEYLNRIETEVFRLMRDSDSISRSRLRPPRIGKIAHVTRGIAPDLFFPLDQVDNYLFEFNGVFRIGDRKALASYDRAVIKRLHEYFHDRVVMFVKRRYVNAIHGPDFPPGFP